MSRLHTTKTGITIGGNYEPPVRQLNSDEENWQKVYLEKGSMFRVAELFQWAAYITFVLALCFIGYWYGK